mgnify:CR=1 FL=1
MKREEGRVQLHWGKLHIDFGEEYVFFDGLHATAAGALAAGGGAGVCLGVQAVAGPLPHMVWGIVPASTPYIIRGFLKWQRVRQNKRLTDLYESPALGEDEK